MARYVAVPTTDTRADDEMEAAFLLSEEGDEDHDHQPRRRGDGTEINGSNENINEEPPSHPLAEGPSRRTTSPTSVMSHVSYDFEYDYPPPPGSPPHTPLQPNSNIPSFAPSASQSSKRPSIFYRALGAILPTSYSRRRVAGGGTDGVFANVIAKPEHPVVEDDGVIYSMPEETQKEAPPVRSLLSSSSRTTWLIRDPKSYAAAQADAVPPYWETTIFTPSSSSLSGETIIDSLPTGSVFVFLWNLIVSMTFQFVGFLLTYVLHTTHAAKMGSRAGLGITLIQYGMYLKNSDDDVGNGGEEVDPMLSWLGPPIDPSTPTISPRISISIRVPPSPTLSNPFTESQTANITATRQVISFLLMTMGWFLLFMSVFNFYRIKRLERGILAGHNASVRPERPRNSEEMARERRILDSIEQAFGISWIPRNEAQTQGQEEAVDRDAAIDAAERGGAPPPAPAEPARTGRGSRDRNRLVVDFY
jgi:hypothetical protein